MSPSQQRIWLISGVLVAILLLIIRLDLCLGMMVGMLASAYNYSRTSRYVTHLLKNGKKGALFFFTGNYVVMILAFCIAIALDEWVSIYTVALGLFWVKPVIVLTEARKR